MKSEPSSARLERLSQDYTAFEISPITKIPAEFKTNDNGINNEFFIFDKPSIATPISSGKGEAIIKAPIKGTTHFRPFILVIEVNLSDFDVFIRFSRSSDNLSFTKRKMRRSPIKAPSPPIRATVITEFD